MQEGCTYFHQNSKASNRFELKLIDPVFDDNPLEITMAVLALEREWRIHISEIERRIDLKLENKGLYVRYEVKVDGAAKIEEKSTDLSKLWGDYPLEVNGIHFMLRLFKKGIMGMATESELYFGEALIPPVEPYELPAESQVVLSPPYRNKAMGKHVCTQNYPPLVHLAVLRSICKT
jgi:hypothetical protein